MSIPNLLSRFARNPRTSSTPRCGSPFILDMVERSLVTIVFGFLLFSLLRGFQRSGNPLDLALLVSEGSVVLFILIRRTTTEVSLRPIDWLIAVAGSIAPLLVRPTGTAEAAMVPAVVSALLMLAGFAMQIAAKLTLNRSFGIVAANRGVKVDGPYRIVRHPMYAGYLLTQIGFLLNQPSLWNFSVYAVGLGFQLWRLLAEERILTEDPAYLRFAGLVRYRLLPGVF
ncbi:methyltransferase family protein [Inquilinus sp. OTU3971]|uniref:methyltransferase family protein n=1 Tax=Inquilinus sp. OTU3971 TaxID=3043855 RepID=UPI00313C8E15